MKLLNHLVTKLFSTRKQNISVENMFEHIYKNKSWGGKLSVSGRGSDLDQTKYLINKLPKILKKYKIQSILDIPCGDFNWMQNVNLTNYKYIGADIVKDIVISNNKSFRKNNICFKHINLIKDQLPQVDLVFTRDCLVHFSNKDIFNSLFNICHSGSKYLLTTTFTNRLSNKDINTGDWQPLSLELKPFNFPKPLILIDEHCTEDNMIYKDKSLGLWKISDLKKHLIKNNKLFINL